MRKADNLPPSCAVVTKSGSLNFLEPSGPVQACNGTDLLYICQHNDNLLDRIGYMFRLVHRSSSGLQQNKSKVVLKYWDPNILTVPLTYSVGGLMMTCEQVETCGLYDPINDRYADVYIVIYYTLQ